MSERRLEEIFEECVTAYLEGRRSIHDSLQLYPAFAAQLTPLLQTAVQLNESFSKVDAPAHVQERVRHRFLADARARRHIRVLTRNQRGAGLFSGLWHQHRFGFAAAAGAVAVLVIAVGSAAMLTNGGSAGDDGVAGRVTTAPATQRATPLAVTSIRLSTSHIRDRGQTVQSADIQQLVSATNNLGTSNPDDFQGSLGDVEDALREADSVLDQIVVAQPDLAAQIQEARDTLRDVASPFGIDLDATPAPTEAVSETPVTSGETPTVAPTDQPTEEPTAAPTPEPTAEPTPEPTATPSRGLPGGDNP